MAGLTISLDPESSSVSDSGNSQCLNLSYSWSSLTGGLDNGTVSVDVPAALEGGSSAVQVFSSSHIATASYDAVNRKIHYTFISPLPAGSAGTLKFCVRFPNGTTADNTAAVIQATSGGDGIPPQTASTTITARASAKVSLGKSINQPPASGGTAIYTITANNSWGYGNYALSSTTIVDTLPPGSVYLSSNPVGVYDSGSHTVTWDLGTFGANYYKTYKVSVGFPSAVFSQSQIVTNNADISGYGPDSVLVTKNASVSSQITVSSPNAIVDKSDSNDPASLRGAFTYRFAVRNSGNVPLTDYTFTDPLPVEFIPTTIYPGGDTNGGPTVTVNVEYQTNTNATWRALPGSPFTIPAYTDPAVSVSSLGLAAGENVSGLRWTYPSLPVGFYSSWPRVAGSLGHPVTGNDRDGAPITGLPKHVNNTLASSFDFDGTNYAATDFEPTWLVDPSPIPYLYTFYPSPNSYQPLQEVPWQVYLRNESGASEPLINPVFVSLLPAGLEYVPDSTSVLYGTLTAPVVSVQENYDGTGRQLVTFAFNSSQSTAGTSYLKFRTRVKPGAAIGTYQLSLQLIDWDNTFINDDTLYYSQVDTNDVDADGNRTESLYSTNPAPISVVQLLAVDTVQWVRGAIDTDFTKYPNVGFTNPGGDVSYKIVVTNPGNIPLSNVRVMGILPHLGDVGVVLHDQPRLSGFGLNLSSPIAAPAGVTIKYSLSGNPDRGELDATLSSPAGAQSGTFSATAPADLSTVRSFMIDFGGTILQPGESKEFAWVMTVPVDAQAGQVAWSSFGMRAQSSINGAPISPSEPAKVGVAIPVSIGSFVWRDTNSNGVQDAGEPGVDGATLELFKSDGSPALDRQGGLVPPTTSQSGGIYRFGSLADGSYFIRVTPPGGYTVSPVQIANAENENDTDSNIDTGRSPPAGSFESGVFAYAEGTEPVAEPGIGGDQDDAADDNGNMTLDFGLIAVPNDFGDFSGFADASSPVSPLLFMGAAMPDIDAPPEKNATATSDDTTGADDEDAVTFGTLTPGQNATVTVVVYNDSASPGFLNAWIDFDNDNSLSGPGEHILDDVVVPANTFGPQTYTFAVPGTSAAGDLPARFRISSTAGAGPTGTGGSGEVEDHFVFIESPLGIGNLVFYDADENGAFTPGEGVAGVGVELYHAEDVPELDVPIDTVFTAADGTYLFNLPVEGTYIVHIHSSAFQLGGPLYLKVPILASVSGDDDAGQNGMAAFAPQDTGVSSDTIVLGLGLAPTTATGETGYQAGTDDAADAAVDLTIDFGFRTPVGIGNLVFLDQDADGVFDAGEGVPNVEVHLYLASQTPGTDAPLYVQATDAQGRYFFSYLPSGTYRVWIPDSQFLQGGPLEGSISLPGTSSGDDDTGEDGVDSNLPAASGIASGPVALASGAEPVNGGAESGAFNTMDDGDDNNFDLTIDFGFTNPSSQSVGLGNLVFVDANGDGLFEEGEGRDGVALQLFTAGSDPQTDIPLRETTTSLGGRYLFGNLAAGSYFVHVPASQFQSSGPLHGVISLPGSGGDYGLDDDFDENGIDAPDPATTGISSDLIALAPDTEPMDFFGEWGSSSYIDNADDDNVDLTVDLGFYIPLSVGNLVYDDQNGNGSADAGEGVAGVTVQLFAEGADPLFDLPLAETTTDGSGLYQISGVLPGTYFLHIPDQAFQTGQPLDGKRSLSGYSSGDDDTGEDGVDEAQPFFFGVNSRTFALAPGLLPAGSAESGVAGASDDADDANTDLTIDLGFVGPVSIGDRVFVDGNQNGLDDDNTPLEGALVELLVAADLSPALDTGGSALPGVITAADGAYEFTNIPGGTYIVRVTPPLHYHATISGGDGDLNPTDGDSNGEAVPGQPYVQCAPVTLTPWDEPTNDGDGDPSTNYTIDFGFIYVPASFVNWQSQNPLGGANGPAQNPDGDLYSNLWEYFHQMPAGSGVQGGAPITIVYNPLTDAYDLQVRQVAGLVGTTVALQGIMDLSASPAGWTSLTGLATSVQTNSDGSETHVYQSVNTHPYFASPASGQVRLRIDVDTDGDGLGDTTAYSGAHGWLRRQFAVQTSSFSMPLVRGAVFSGTIDAVVGGSSLDVASAVGGSGSIAAAISSGVPYYVEVISGDNAGHRFEVDEPACTATTIALLPASPLSTQNTLPASLAGDLIALRPHHTLGTLFPHPRFTSGNGQTSADRILRYNGTGYETRWLFRNGVDPKWVLSGDATLSSQAGLIIPPDEGYYVYPRTVAPTLDVCGEVRSWPFACRLRQGYSMIGGGWPVVQSPAARLMTTGNGFTGGKSAATSDRIYLWNGDTTSGAQGYTSYFLLKVSTLNYWTEQGNGSLPNNNNAALFQPYAASVINSVQGHSSWVMPVPWTP